MQLIITILKILHKIKDWLPKSKISQINKNDNVTACISLFNPSISTDATLTKVAYSHAIWMRQNRKLSHVGDNNRTHMYRLRNTEFSNKLVAEYVLYSLNEKSTISQLEARLKEKPTQTYKHVGIGSCDGYWCILLST